MDKASQDALDIAKIAAMVSGQLKQVDQHTISPVTKDKHASNRINPEIVYHQQKQKLQQAAPAAPPPPPVAAPPQPAPAPVTVAAPPPISIPAPAPQVVQAPPAPAQNNDALIKALTDLTKKVSSLTTSVNKLIKTQTPKS